MAAAVEGAAEGHAAAAETAAHAAHPAGDKRVWHAEHAREARIERRARFDQLANLERLERAAQCPSFSAGHAADEAGECRLPVAGLVKRVQHKLGDIGFPALGRAVTPRTAISLTPRESFLGEPVENRHHRGVSQIPRGQLTADLADRQRLGTLPEDIHDGALKLTQPVHNAMLLARHRPE